MKQIIPGLYTFTGLGAGRVYLIEEPGGLTLVDAGLASAADKVLAQLAQRGYQPTDVKRILVTHGHPDHVGGLKRLREVTGAQTVASPAERPFIEGTEPVRRPPAAQMGRLAKLLFPPEREERLDAGPVDHEVREGDTIKAMGGLAVLDVPGHSPGHLAYWQPTRRILFCGDVTMALPFGLRPPFAHFTPDMAENDRSLQKLAALEPKVICFGHGPPLTQEAAPTLLAYAAKRAR